MHPVQDRRDQHDSDQDAPGQVERLEVGLDALLAKDVGEHDDHGLQRRTDLREHPADDQQQTDQHIGQPRAHHPDLLVMRHLVELHLDAAHPLARPFLRIGEIPGALGHQEARARRRGDDRQANETAKQRRELGPEEHAGEGIGNGESQAGKEGERHHLEARLPALFLAEEAGQHHHHHHRHHCADQRVHDRYMAGDELQEDLPARTLRHQLRADRCSVEAAIDADDDRRAHRAEGHRRTLHQHAEQHRRHRRETDRHQQRRRDRRRRAKAGRALDEAPEQPRNDDCLDPAVGADRGEPGTDGRDAAGVLERVQQQDRAEDDPQHADGYHQALEGRGEHAIDAHVPHEQTDERGDYIDDRHRTLCRPAQADEQDCCEQDWRKGQEGQGAGLHRLPPHEKAAPSARHEYHGCRKSHRMPPPCRSLI